MRKTQRNRFLFTICLVLMFTGCSSPMGSGSGEIDYLAMSNALSVSTVIVGADILWTTSGDDGKGVFITGRTVRLSPYQISKYLITYESWYEVRTWAEGRTEDAYSFYHAGTEGSGGTAGAEPTDDAKLQPVTYISWTDAMVWCNALSEKEGLTPVYYTDSSYTTPFRTSHNYSCNDSTKVAGMDYNPYVDWDADGYRLPTEAEWECAARGGDSSAAAWSYQFSGSDTFTDVAQDINSTYSVGTRNPNTLGIYDMNGDVYQWCYDWQDDVTAGDTADSNGVVTDPRGPSASSSVSYKMYRGGGFSISQEYQTVADRTYMAWPSTTDKAVGFRIAKSL